MRNFYQVSFLDVKNTILSAFHGWLLIRQSGLGGGTKPAAGAIVWNNEQSFPYRQKANERGTDIPMMPR